MTFSSFIAAGVDKVYVGVVGSDGYLVGGSTSAPAAGNTNGSLMRRVKGVVNANPTIAAPTVVNVPGDNGSEGSFIFQADSEPSFTLEKSVFDLVMQALAQGTATYTDNDVIMGVLQPVDIDAPDLCWVLQSPSKKKDAGVNGLKAWSGYFVPLTTATPLGRQAYATRAAASEQMQIVANPAEMLWDGVDIDDTNFSTAGGRIVPFTSDYPICFQRFTGGGTPSLQDTFVLAVTPATATSIRVRVNGVVVDAADWTLDPSTRELVFDTPPADGDIIVVRIGMAA